MVLPVSAIDNNAYSVINFENQIISLFPIYYYAGKYILFVIILLLKKFVSWLINTQICRL